MPPQRSISALVPKRAFIDISNKMCHNSIGGDLPPYGACFSFTGSHIAGCPFRNAPQLSILWRFGVLGNRQRHNRVQAVSSSGGLGHEENITFSDEAMRDLNVLIEAEREIVNSTIQAYQEYDLETSMKIKPLASAINSLCEIVKTRHIGRLSRGECSMQLGAAVEELLNSFERIASHCVAVSGMVRRAYQENPDYHVHSAKAKELSQEQYNRYYQEFLTKYDVVSNIERPLSVEAESVT